MHNAVFTTLREDIDFYNDNLGGVIPEVNANLIDIGQYIGFGLAESEKDDLDAFLNTLSGR